MKRVSATLLAVPLGLLIGLAVAGVPSRAAVPPSITTTTSTTTTTIVGTETTVAPLPVVTDPPTETSTESSSEGPLPQVAPDQVRVVVANASGRANVGRAFADLSAGTGFTNAAPVTAVQRSDTSVLYVRPGFDREAQDFVSQMGLTGIAVAPLPSTAVSPADDAADLLLVIGRDRAT
ncbi:MAG: LytR C-terminal domain-containing protein [Ilumatobacteraceae bacterium]